MADPGEVYALEMRSIDSSLFSLTLLVLASGVQAFAEETPGTPPKAGSEALDTIAMIAQHRPTSGDGKPGIFRMQGEISGDIGFARGEAHDDLTGSVGFYLPITDGRMAIRIGTDVFRYEFSEHTDLGFGDLGLRWDWAPEIASPNALLVQVDTTWDTASRDRLGLNTHTIAPGATYVIPIGKQLTFAPGIDHRFDWGTNDGPDISLTRIHGYVGWAGDGKVWGLLDPNLNLDHEAKHDWLAIDVLAGVALRKEAAVWIRPGIALGSERPYDLHIGAGVDVAF